MTRRGCGSRSRAFGGQVDLRGLAGDRVPVEVGREALARGHRPALRRGGIVEHRADRRGQPRDVAWCERHAGLPVDHRLAQPTDIRRHQRCARRRGLQRDDAERLVMAGQHDGVGGVQQPHQVGVIQPADERCGLEHLVFSGLLDQPVLLRAFAGDGQRGARVGAPDARQRRDGVVNALLVLQPSQVQQLGRALSRMPRVRTAIARRRSRCGSRGSRPDRARTIR